MTFYEQLKQEQRAGKVITAYRCIEKCETVPSYRITVARNGKTEEVYKAARTTWKKKFRGVLNEVD